MSCPLLPAEANWAAVRGLVYAACILVVVLVLLGWVVLALRRKYVGRREESSGGSNFDMADLERLRAEGQLSEAEFRRARALVLGVSPRAEAGEAGALMKDEPDDDEERADAPPHEEAEDEPDKETG